jgi:hypothetical protein
MQIASGTLRMQSTTTRGNNMDQDIVSAAVPAAASVNSTDSTKSSDLAPATETSAGLPAVDRTGRELAMQLVSDHKGKLAISVAATLGIMIYYNWRERRLAKKDPAGHARLQRLKALVRHDEAVAESRGRDASGAQAHKHGKTNGHGKGHGNGLQPSGNSHPAPELATSSSSASPSRQLPSDTITATGLPVYPEASAPVR